MWLVLIGIGVVVFAVWVAAKAVLETKRGTSLTSGTEAPRSQSDSEPRQAGDAALLRTVSERIKARQEAEGVSFWDVAEAEAEATRAGVYVTDVRYQELLDAEEKDALEEAERQVLFSESHLFNLADYVDLGGLDSTPLKVRGKGNYTDKPASFMSGVCRLVREPENTFDPNAIVAFIGEQKVGYVSASRAASMAPLMDELGRPLIIRADLSGSPVILLLPTLPAFRAWVASQRS
ncbi:HIRAN domain-containing protein [Rhodoglobus sp. NPDC076762]